jgi:hypothetical protein
MKPPNARKIKERNAAKRGEYGAGLECGDVPPLSTTRHVASFQSADMSAHSKSRG